MQNDASTDDAVLTAAKDYLPRGWKIVELPRGAKGPKESGWPEAALTTNLNNVAERFAGQKNIGVLLGPQSGGLVDVDLDCLEACKLARSLLRETITFGRASKPQSHWLYTSNLCETEPKAAIKFTDLDGSVIVELRVGGGGHAAQTMFPPSLHPSGEQVEWDVTGEPEYADGAELRKGVATLAAAALLARHYPAEGSRHEAALTLGGVLARMLAKESTSPGELPGDEIQREMVEWVERFVLAVAEAAGDEEAEERAKSAAGAVDLLQRGEPCPGLPRFCETWGDAVANRCAGWLGYQEDALDPFVALARLSRLAYEQQRHDIAKRMNVRVGFLDEQVAKARTALAQSARAAAEVKPTIDQLEASARDIINSKDVLALFARDFRQFVAGEEKNAEML
jgi:hypothetical protein